MDDTKKHNKLKFNKEVFNAQSFILIKQNESIKENKLSFFNSLNPINLHIKKVTINDKYYREGIISFKRKIKKP